MSLCETIIQIDHSEGAALDWLVAQAEQEKVFVSISASGTKSCWRHDKPKQQYSPSSRWRECGPLLDKYDITFSHCGEMIQAFCSTVNPDSSVSALGPDRRKASCRAIAKSFFGNIGVVPFALSTHNAESARFSTDSINESQAPMTPKQ